VSATQAQCTEDFVVLIAIQAKKTADAVWSMLHDYGFSDKQIVQVFQKSYAHL
jgi:hypothetical protein